MRFVGTCYRAHDPRWSFKPISGEGAALRGGRFNPRGVPALYLSLQILTAIREANHGFAHRIDPCVLCSYRIDCVDVVDLRTDAACQRVDLDPLDLACAWATALADGLRPPSWSTYDRLAVRGASGILVPSYAVGATVEDANLVLWKWGPDHPYRVEVDDPSGRLPKNQLSWS